MRSHRILTCILSILLCFISCVAAIFMVSLLVNKVNIPISWNEAYINNSLKFIYFLVGPAVGLVYGLIRKRKGAWTAILLVIASLASVVLLAVVL